MKRNHRILDARLNSKVATFTAPSAFVLAVVLDCHAEGTACKKQ